MKRVSVLLYTLFASVFAISQDVIYRGSTPANNVVRNFLDIPLNDSVDFIRWTLTLSNDQFSLYCIYGIGKPNTSGFVIDNKVSIKGSLQKEAKYYHLSNGNKKLSFAALNDNLLHISNREGRFLLGNGGWSYTLNNVSPLGSNHINFLEQNMAVDDSMVFEGRTPCGVPGLIEPGAVCYKIKWRILLYGDVKKNEPTTYKVFATKWRKEGGRRGNWQIVKAANGSSILQLNDEAGKGFLYLMRIENILLFTDASGNILTGDQDFSYTLNKIG